MLIQCRNCGNELPVRMGPCPRCGARQRVNASLKATRVAFLALLGLAALAWITYHLWALNVLRRKKHTPERPRRQPPPVTSEMKEREAGLVTDLRRVWHGPRTLAHDRKRMRRLVAMDLILLRDDVIRQAKSPLPLGVPNLMPAPSPGSRRPNRSSPRSNDFAHLFPGRNTRAQRSGDHPIPDDWRHPGLPSGSRFSAAAGCSRRREQRPT